MIVPLCFDKSKWTAVAVLRVLKAGDVFYVLNLAIPLKRLEKLCLAVNASVVLTSFSRAELARSLVCSGAAITVGADSPSETECLDETEPNACCSPVTPEGACYVVFTSGSTGKPKGIVMSHRARVTSIKKIQNPLYLQRSSRVLQFAPYTFEPSVYDHLFTLATGACVCVPSEASRQSALGNALVQFSANWVTLTPSVAQILDPERLPGLRVSALAGEAIPRAGLDRCTPHIRLLGLYGPRIRWPCNDTES